MFTIDIIKLIDNNVIHIKQENNISNLIVLILLILIILIAALPISLMLDIIFAPLELIVYIILKIDRRK